MSLFYVISESFVCGLFGLIFEELIFTKLMQKHKFGGFVFVIMLVFCLQVRSNEVKCPD